jgi:tRNA threonylcarbamoyl adenosine modification protein YeaZ
MESTDRPNLALVYRQSGRPTKVAVATGPGSFTGLRVGVSFGLGLAIGLRIPIIPLPSLDLQAARSDTPVVAVLEAGRGRVYYQLPGGKPMLGEPADIPASHPLVGNVTPKTEAALIAARHRFRPEKELRDFSGAAALVLEAAREVSYGSLEIEYMQSFSAKA